MASGNNFRYVIKTFKNHAHTIFNDYYYAQDEWGFSRYVNGYLTIALIDAKYNGQNKDAQNVQRAAKQMQIMLGDNTWGADGNPLCLVTGFSKYSPQRPHFRASSGETFDMKVKDDTTIIDGYDDKYTLIGGIIGGPKADGTYKNNAGSYVKYDDKRSEYAVNEVASDYNSVLASAAAGLYYFFGTGNTYDIPGVKNSYNGKPKNEVSQPQLQSISELPMLLMTKVKSVRAAEKYYSYKEVGTVSGSKTFPLSYENITKIELDYQFNGGDGGANLTFNDWEIQNKESV